MLTNLSIAFSIALASTDAAGGVEHIAGGAKHIAKHILDILDRPDCALVDAGCRTRIIACHGFPISSAEEIAPALPAVDKLSAAQCRRDARERFGAGTIPQIFCAVQVNCRRPLPGAAAGGSLCLAA